jgi:hypothetical protein
VVEPEILTNFRAIVELNAMTNDVEHLREAMLIATSIAECEENKILLMKCGYHEVLFKVLDMFKDRAFHRNSMKFLKELSEDDDCREAMIPYMSRIVTQLCSSDDFATQMYSTLLLFELSQKPSTLDAMMKHCHKVCATLDLWIATPLPDEQFKSHYIEHEDRWLANPLPDARFQSHVIKLASMIAVHDAAKLEMCTGKRDVVPGSKDELDGVDAGKLRIVKSCLRFARSKNAVLQRAAAEFISAFSGGTGDSADLARQSLVNAGALWRLKTLKSDGRTEKTQAIASEVLEKNLLKHWGAARIQKWFRGRIHIVRGLRKQKEAAAAAENAPKAWVDPRSARASSIASLASAAAQESAEGGGV